VLIFFIAGLLFICASSTSITWERIASRPETGLLIPSVYDSNLAVLATPDENHANDNEWEPVLVSGEPLLLALLHCF
jgi:hypothetical protein